ncbi:unnamed protein product [Schistocephalus solidus]|uniref:Transmembrane protein 188 n=1 Tax=Schistocephalus solidus TaxID=70667 RepID=A0A183SJA7_SCHSO|nr:unnamed protein product [Schistocephalus solidus]
MMAGQSLARIQFRPVVGRCTRAGPRGEAVRLSEDWVNSTLRPQSKKRRCPPGQYIGKIPPIQVARRRLMGDKTEINYKDLKLELKRTLNLHQNLTVYRMSEYQIMAYLEPKRSLLNAQFDAETLFQEMTQITFSPGELFSMTIISLGLAVFFSALTFIIALGSRRGTLAAVDKSIIQKGLSRLWRHVSTAISVNLLWLRMHWRVYRDRRPTWQRRLSAAEAREDRNIFKMGSILRQKAEFEHMEELRTRLVNQVIQLSTEAARKAEIVRKQELQAQEQLLSEKDAQGEEVGLIEQPNIFRLGPLEADPLRLPPYQGPTSLEAYLFPPRREIPSFFFFRDNEFDGDGKGKTGSASEMEG